MTVMHVAAQHQLDVDAIGEPLPINYTAACPGCGRDATWTGTPRNEGRGVVLTIGCECS